MLWSPSNLYVCCLCIAQKQSIFLWLSIDRVMTPDVMVCVCVCSGRQWSEELLHVHVKKANCV